MVDILDVTVLTGWSYKFRTLTESDNLEDASGARQGLIAGTSIAIRESHLAADAIEIGFREDPIVKTGCTEIVDRETGCHQGYPGFLAPTGCFAKRYVCECRH